MSNFNFNKEEPGINRVAKHSRAKRISDTMSELPILKYIETIKNKPTVKCPQCGESRYYDLQEHNGIQMCYDCFNKAITNEAIERQKHYGLKPNRRRELKRIEGVKKATAK